MMIRKMQKDDIGQVVTIENTLFSDGWSEQGFLDALESKYTIMLVLQEESAPQVSAPVLGYIVMYVSFDEGEISKVAVAKDMQQKGIGSRLLEAMLEAGEEKGIARYVLEVRNSNLPAIGLYSKYLFKKIGIRKGFYEKPREDAIIMIRERTDEEEKC